MTLLLQMCMSCWATLAWRKNALSRQLLTMRKLSSSSRTSLRYTLHAVALSHAQHLSRRKISRSDDQPHSRPNAGSSLIQDCAAECNQMTGVGWECTASWRNSCTTWKAVEKVLEPSKAMAIGKMELSGCISTHEGPVLAQGDDRRIAEAHYKMALTLQFLEDPERALEHANKATAVCRARISRLSAAPLGADAAVEDPADAVSPQQMCSLQNILLHCIAHMGPVDLLPIDIVSHTHVLFV